MPKLEVTLKVFGIEISGFAQVLRDLVTAKLDPDAADALTKMIEEVRKNFEIVVNAISPFYGITSPATLRKTWGGYYSGFVDSYFKQWKTISTQCHIVIAELERVKASQAWKTRIPLVRNAFAELDALCQKWAGADEALNYEMDQFMQAAKAGLKAVNDHVIAGKPAEAFQVMRDLLANIEQQIEQVKSGLDKLSAISKKIAK